MFRAGSGDEIGSWQFVTNIITQSQQFTLPAKIKDNKVFVRLFGGGGGALSTRLTNDEGAISAAGGGGWMNSGWINITPGSVISISIGGGGARTYLSSGGYGAGGSGGSTSFGTYLSAAGGTGGCYNNTGIYGGSGGSGGAVFVSNCNKNIYGGTGYQFGGGSAVAWYRYGGRPNNIVGGSGGANGGSGSAVYVNSSGRNNISNANNGINTISILNESNGIEANGIGYGLGGGYAGGGGGYGANGGKAGNYSTQTVYPLPGGGGGYGKNGYGGTPNSWWRAGNQNVAGGGGAYGPGGSNAFGDSITIYNAPGYGAGGSSDEHGMSGICIIQYYSR